MAVHPLVSWNDLFPWQFQVNFQEKEGKCFKASWGLSSGTQTMLFPRQSVEKCWEAQPRFKHQENELYLLSGEAAKGSWSYLLCHNSITHWNERIVSWPACVFKNLLPPPGDSYSTKHFCKLFLWAQLSKSCFYHYMLNLSSHVSLGLLLCCPSLGSLFSWWPACSVSLSVMG